MYNREAQVVSTEARVKNNRYNLNYWAPTINLSRDLRWGRNNESFGEDPYLTSLFGSEYVKGLQGEDEKYLKVVSCLKHFVANNCEYERQTGSSEMTEEDLRNYYSRTFRDVISEANPGAVMTSYNATTVTRNGEKLWDYISMTANKDILTNLLRRSWGFKGYIPGDCGAVAGLNVHFSRMHLICQMYLSPQLLQSRYLQETTLTAEAFLLNMRLKLLSKVI